jgi:hypothetical protein
LQAASVTFDNQKFEDTYGVRLNGGDKVRTPDLGQ